MSSRIAVGAGRALALAALVLGAGANAQTPDVAAPPAAAPASTPAPPLQDGAPRELVVGIIGELSQNPVMTKQLRGARETTNAEWPASFYVRFNANESCTGSIVGPQAVLMAAHCIADRGVLKFTAKDVAHRDVAYEADCRRHEAYEAYPRNVSADYVLCKVRTPVRGVPFERVNRNPAAVGIGTKLLLTGFGCTTDAGTGGKDDVYRIGDVEVSSLPTAPDQNYYTANNQVALCFGDSGGPAFLQAHNGSRTQVSVNSAVSRQGDRLTETSFLSSISTPQALALLRRKWEDDKPLAICGLEDVDPPGCRR